MSLSDVAVELYGLAPGEFVAARAERVATAKAAGERELAAAIGALRRPTVAAWAVNLLARSASEEVGALLALGDALRTAQRELSGPRLRALTAQRGQVVNALAKRAAELAAEQGRPVGDAVLREVGNSLTAALADPEVAEKVRLGTLASATSYDGFGPAGPELAVVAAPKPPAPAKKAPQRDSAKQRRAEAAAERRREIERRIAAAEAELGTAESERDSAEKAATAAAETLRDNAARIEELRAELAAAEERHRFARTAERAARETLRAAETETERARRRVETARRALPGQDRP
ncbi:hypothetical protein [Nocardia harenae]|uniref:hypothetical protein n=1 Tax=Nocardia harenae TaxID=358707 RepID=UPI00082CB547|nr:hypothetical protein [Nocardia harenae]